MYSKVMPEVKAVGELSLEERARYLEEVQDPELVKQGFKAGIFGGPPKPYEHTEHQIGFIGPFDPSDAALRPIHDAARVVPDTTLERITVRLDRLRVFDYPGGGTHHILFTFKAENQVGKDGGSNEPVTFSQVYTAEEDQGAGVTGYPVLVGLTVGPLGAQLSASTVNVKNEDDERALGFLESGPFQRGVGLLTTAQPAIQPLSDMAVGLAKMILSRNRNRKVQDFYVGLDFDQNASFGARLAVGNYIVVQAPSSAFRWQDWRLQPTDGQIVLATDVTQGIPYNYIIFRVSRHPK